MKVLTDLDNKLCNRKEFSIEIDHPKQKTPKNEDVRKKVAELSKTKEELVVVKKINTPFGLNKSYVNAYSYNDEASFKKFEVINKKKKDGKKEKGKKQKTK